MKENPFIVLALNNEVETSRMKGKLAAFGNELINANTKNEIIKLLTLSTVDLLIVNMQIEDTDAIDICKEIRKTEGIQQPYIIVLSDRPEDYIQTLVLDSGADDFILKPFKMEVLIARIKALMIRKSVLSLPLKSNQKKLIIDEERYLVYFDEKEIQLPKKEFNILSLLYSEPEKIFTRKEITDKVSRKDWSYKDHSIDIFIYNLRQELGGELIQTIKGVGYKLSLL